MTTEIDMSAEAFVNIVKKEFDDLFKKLVNLINGQHIEKWRGGPYGDCEESGQIDNLPKLKSEIITSFLNDNKAELFKRYCAFRISNENDRLAKEMDRIKARQKFFDKSVDNIKKIYQIKQ